MSETYMRCDGCQSSAPADLFPPDALHHCGGKWRERNIHELDYPAPRAPAAGATPARELFNEDTLRAAIVGVWGEYGAHVEVFDMLLTALRERDAAREDAARLDAIERGEVEIECMGTTVHYQIVHGPAGTFVASPSAEPRLTLRQAIDAARAAAEGRR